MARSAAPWSRSSPCRLGCTVFALLACAAALASGSGPLTSPKLEQDPAREARLQALADKWRLTAAQAKAAGKPDGAGKIRICISAYTPQVYCDASKPQETYTGYQVELFRELAQRVTWLSNSSAWFFDCMPWTPMIDDLLSSNGTCLMAPAGLSFTKERLEKGLYTSWVIDKEGFKIMTRPTRKELNLWTPFTVFTAPLWVLLFVTSIAVGALVWVVDTRACSLLKPRSEQPLRRHGKRPKRLLKTWMSDGVGVSTHGAAARGQQARGTPQQSPPSASFIVQHGPPLETVPSGDAAEVKWKQHEAEMPADEAWAPGGRRLEQPNPAHSQQPSFTGLPQQQQQQLWSGMSFASSMAPGYASATSIDTVSLQSGAASDERSHTILRFIGVRKGGEPNAWRQLRLMMSRSFLRMPDMGEPPAVKSLPAKLILFAYGLLILIIVALYTASAAAQLTAQSLRSDIRSLDDLRGKAVVTWDGYADKMREQGLPVIRMPWETERDEEAMLDMLRAGQASAMIMPTSFIDWQVAQHCEFEGVGDQWSVMDAGIGYNKRMPPQLQESMDTAIAIANEQGVLEQSYNIHIRKNGGRCGSRGQGSEMGQIGLEEVAGLWVLLSISLAVSLAFLALYWLQRYRKNAHKLATGIATRAASQASTTFRRVVTRRSMVQRSKTSPGIVGGV